jgi:hypothetical protein
MTFSWELVILDTTPSIFAKFWCTLGSLKEEQSVLTNSLKNAKRCLALNEQEYVALHSESTPPPSMHHKRKEMNDFVCKTASGKS